MVFTPEFIFFSSLHLLHNKCLTDTCLKAGKCRGEAFINTLPHPSKAPFWNATVSIFPYFSLWDFRTCVCKSLPQYFHSKISRVHHLLSVHHLPSILSPFFCFLFTDKWQVTCPFLITNSMLPKVLMCFQQPSVRLWETLWCNRPSLWPVLGQGCWSWSQCVLSDQKPRSEAPLCTASIYWGIVSSEEFGLWGLSRPRGKHHVLGGGLWYLWNDATRYSNGHSNCEGKEPGVTALFSL